MRKYKMISALAEETAKKAVRNEENWREYLNTASRLYKYPFKEQLLIYAQRPDATACASIEIWNEKMHCWVNKGAKGIALIDEDSFSGLKYVFDISDVHKARRIGRFPSLWEMRMEHTEAVLSRLEGIYGETDEKEGFAGRIREIAERIAGDCYKELASDMRYLKEGSFLEELDDLNVEVRIRQTLADSIAYTVLRRCGMEESGLAEEIRFPYIHEFNTVETLSQLGSSVSDLSKPVLMEIGKAIGVYEREKAQYLEPKNSGEKGLENTSETRYNALKRESEKQEEQSATQTGEAGERSQNDESDIREERGLHDPDVTDGRTAGGDADKIRTDEKEIFTGEQERSLHGASSERETERASSDYSGTGRAEDGASDSTDGESGGRNGTAQSGKPDALGTEDEQHQAFGGGERTDGTDLQLNKEQAEPDSGELSGFSLEEPEGTYQQLSLFPSFEEQVGTVAATQASVKYTMPAAFSLPQEQLDTILRSGGGRDNSRSRIYAKYRQGKTAEEMAEFLKKEYQTTGKGFDFGENPVSVWFDEMGMRVGYGTSAKENPVTAMSWSEVESHIRIMVENGTYMSANEAFLVDEVERQRVSNDLFNFFRDGIEEVPEDIPIQNYNYPESITNLCGLLSTQEGRDIISRELSHAKEQIEAGEKRIKWRYVKSPEHLLSEIADLSAEKRELPALDTVEVRNEDFITQDEIDYRLTGGSSFHNGKFRIYEYFMEGHDKKDNIAFLKNEYGTGGSSHALPGSDRGHEDHSAKGIRLEKGDYGSPYAKVLLKWNVVEKRIRELVKADKYLTPEGREAYAQYKKEQAEEAMRREQDKELLPGGEEPETDTSVKETVHEAETGQSGIEQLNKRVSEMSAVVKLCKALDREEAAGWNEEAQAVTISDGERTLEGKAVYDFLFTEAADYVMLQTISGNTQKALEMDALLKGAKQYALRYEEKPERFTVTETSDAFSEPFAAWDNEEEDYHAAEDGTVPTFETEQEAAGYSSKANEALTETEAEPQEETEGREDDFSDIDAPTVREGQKESKPELDKSGAVNYRITPDTEENTGKGFAPKEKFRQNVEAIRTLEKIESENRIATPEEQEILAKYVGWGGLADAFDESKANWAKEYQELKSLLSPEEYDSARESTLNAYYTNPVIIQSIYEVLGNMGFSKGNILEIKVQSLIQFSDCLAA